MSQKTTTGSSFLLNARGSVVELTDEEANKIAGGNDMITIEPGDGMENDLGCRSFSQGSGCDWNWGYDP